AAMIAPWKPLFSSGYFANRRGAGARCPRNRRKRLVASAMSVLSGQIAQNSSQNDAWMMWKTTDAVRTVPAIHWRVTHGHLPPTWGRNPVKSSVNIDAAINQWNARATLA